MNQANLKMSTPSFRPFGVNKLGYAKQQQTFFNAGRMSKKKLGIGSFSSRELPLSLSIGVASAGVIVLGTSIAEGTLKSILIGGGLIGLGFSIYNLFSGSEVPPSGEKGAGDVSGLAAQEDFDGISAKFLNPKMYESQLPFSNKTISLILTNPSNKPVEFTLIVSEYEGDPGQFGGDAFRKPVTVPANGSLPIDFSVTTGNVFPTTIRLVAKKLRGAADQPVKMTELVYFR